jgi:FixJ family two-component response regulator
MLPVLAHSRLLVVDDDPASNLLNKLHLLRAGYEVTTAFSVPEARLCLAAGDARVFEAVVTDYRMPGEDGLDLLAHVRESDPTLSVILLTAEGEKDLMASSFRSGAEDFLEKPILASILLTSVAKAIAATRRRRSLSTDAAAARQLGDSQNNLLCLETASLENRLRVRFHPHQRAGGDFAAAFALDEDRFVLLVSDVSGHDLRTAYHSAYLQGVARGMFEQGANLHDVFAHLNRLLLRDWNSSGTVALSLSAFGVAVDLFAEQVACLNCGLPTACLVDADGWPSARVPAAESPLGWFDTVAPVVAWKNEGGTLHLWSDGLQDLAESRGCSSLALAYRLHLGDAATAEILQQATDDVLALQLDLSPVVDRTRTAPPRPILNETYCGGDIGRIDALQDYCETSLRTAIPAIPEEPLLSALLCIRESLLNALSHGCQRRSDRFARLQVMWVPEQHHLLVRVSDDGAGHRFDLEQHQRDSAVTPPGAHNGLYFIKNLTTRTIFSASGNSVTMEIPI